MFKVHSAKFLVPSLSVGRQVSSQFFSCNQQPVTLSVVSHRDRFAGRVQPSILTHYFVCLQHELLFLPILELNLFQQVLQLVLPELRLLSVL